LDEFDAITRINFQVATNIGGNGDLSFAGEHGHCHISDLLIFLTLM
jgi:hypothetical protein